MSPLYIMKTSKDNTSNHDKVAVVTGSSRGIGKAIAIEFARNGYCVVLNSRDEKDLSRTAQDIGRKSETIKVSLLFQAMCHTKIFVHH